MRPAKAALGSNETIETIYLGPPSEKQEEPVLAGQEPYPSQAAEMWAESDRKVAYKE